MMLPIWDALEARILAHWKHRLFYTKSFLESLQKSLLF